MDPTVIRMTKPFHRKLGQMPPRVTQSIPDAAGQWSVKREESMVVGSALSCDMWSPFLMMYWSDEAACCGKSAVLGLCIIFSVPHVREHALCHACMFRLQVWCCIRQCQ